MGRGYRTSPSRKTSSPPRTSSSASSIRSNCSNSSPSTSKLGCTHHLIKNLGISDCESEGNNEYDNRPRYIRTSSNRYYQMKYFETRNMFTRSKMMVYNCTGFPPGQYSFPFSFKTFEGWPASFIHYTPQKKGIITYSMTAAIEPATPQFQIQGGREIILR